MTDKEASPSVESIEKVGWESDDDPEKFVFSLMLSLLSSQGLIAVPALSIGR